LPNLESPRTFDEKIQWYKLYYRNPLMVQLTDKYAVRQYVIEHGLEGILNDLYGIFQSAGDIDFDSLPDQFVLKATHGCGMNIICKNKETLDRDKCRSDLQKWLKINFFYVGRAWAYKDIEPRIICEKYLENNEHGELIDYKFYCYADKPEVLFVCAGRFSKDGVKYNAYDMSWNRIHAYKGRPGLPVEFDKPENFDEMVEIATTLCRGFPFVRVDLYSVQGRILFGELTFYPDNGVIPFTPDKYNYFFGDMFQLPDKALWSSRNWL
jgi:hypothetical protein